ncbi:hypothetical protein EW026_g632 [Hermanssonia centrifuga]|uniref:DUF6593 domain-containing protein n=1 Tax=Hermanssonia centrifuga TaxID=98765 RepID=A0A4S4KU35_9APHY|nr:hypothetical protein EW026_g632 [Hermanssonia centrifuga]
MLNRALPYYLEDRTGVFTGSDFDDMYDRMFLRVSPPPSHLSHAPSSPASPSPFSLMIYASTRRSSTQKEYAYAYRERNPSMRQGEPAIVLEFGPRGALGNATFIGPSVGKDGKEKSTGVTTETIFMGHWLKKTGMFSGSLSRKFRASDGEEYRWMHQGAEGQEWTLVDSRDYLIAHYNLKPQSKPAYTTSGNVLTIHEAFGHLSVEILASLTIMRHIAAHNL